MHTSALNKEASSIIKPLWSSALLDKIGRISINSCSQKWIWG